MSIASARPPIAADADSALRRELYFFTLYRLFEAALLVFFLFGPATGLVEPLLQLSKCPDFVVNRGHYFGTGYAVGEPGLSDKDKRALIEFLKTF